MFETFFIIAVSLYFIQLFILIIGAQKKFPKLKENELPTISVVVAARNEEENILRCLESLDKLEYPSEKIEIIIVNDHSSDRTNSIISEFIAGKEKFKCIIPTCSVGNLKGKSNALANAFALAEGEILLTTDADCEVSPAWAKTIASYYKDDVAIVCGFTAQKDYDAFAGMQSADFIFLLTVAAGAMNLGKPLSCIGNNMSIRKKVYEEVGGYESIPFSVTEDFSLLMAVHDLGKYGIIYPLDAGALVVSQPCENIKSLFWQKKRWGVGGMKSGITGYIVMLWGYLSNLALLLTPFFFSTVSLYLCLFKITVDYFFISPVYRTLKLKIHITHFIAFEIYYIVYVLLLPFAVLPNRRIKWKGREF